MGAVRRGLARLYAVAERHPDLKPDALLQNLSSRPGTLETALSDRREVYNDAANARNVRIETSPDRMTTGGSRSALTIPAADGRIHVAAARIAIREIVTSHDFAGDRRVVRAWRAPVEETPGAERGIAMPRSRVRALRVGGVVCRRVGRVMSLGEEPRDVGERLDLDRVP